ncbi:MAG TPA: hypothetical protein VJ024_08195, partial [Thermodesulfovibrionales bacterium]|nr:hypothetical protein [Thermodesulfovibrionales bacterium]
TPAAFIAFAFASMERVGDGLILLALSESIDILSSHTQNCAVMIINYHKSHFTIINEHRAWSL